MQETCGFTSFPHRPVRIIWNPTLVLQRDTLTSTQTLHLVCSQSEDPVKFNAAKKEAIKKNKQQHVFFNQAPVVQWTEQHRHWQRFELSIFSLWAHILYIRSGEMERGHRWWVWDIHSGAFPEIQQKMHSFLSNVRTLGPRGRALQSVHRVLQCEEVCSEQRSHSKTVFATKQFSSELTVGLLLLCYVRLKLLWNLWIRCKNVEIKFLRSFGNKNVHI